MGYQFVSVGADVVGLSGYFNPIVAAFNKSAQPQTQSQSIYSKDK